MAWGAATGGADDEGPACGTPLNGRCSAWGAFISALPQPARKQEIVVLKDMGMFIVALGLGWFLILEAFAAIKAYAGYCLRRRRMRILCTVIGGRHHVRGTALLPYASRSGRDWQLPLYFLLLWCLPAACSLATSMADTRSAFLDPQEPTTPG